MSESCSESLPLGHWFFHSPEVRGAQSQAWDARVLPDLSLLLCSALAGICPSCRILVVCALTVICLYKHHLCCHRSSYILHLSPSVARPYFVFSHRWRFHIIWSKPSRVTSLLGKDADRWYRRNTLVAFLTSFPSLYHQAYYDYSLRSSLSPIISSESGVGFSLFLDLRMDFYWLKPIFHISFPLASGSHPT